MTPEPSRHRSGWTLLVVALLAPPGFTACSGEAPGGAPGAQEEEGGHQAGEEHETHADQGHELHVEPGSLAGWDVEVGPVARTTITAEMVLPGVLTADENRTARIAPLVPGQVARLGADLGSRIRRGDTLARLNAPEFTRAQTDYLRAYTQAELSRTDYERALVLREQRALEDREFLRRQSTYEEALTGLQAAESLLRSLGVEADRLAELRRSVDVTSREPPGRAVAPFLPLRSPLDGVVTERNAVLGEHVPPGRALFTVSDLSVLWARLNAYEDQVPHLDPEAEVVIRNPLLPDREFPGRITVVADRVDPDLRTLRVRAEVANPEGLLKPNMYIRGFLRMRDPDRERLVVPEDAVQLLDGEHVVFVEQPREPGEEHRVFRARHVTPGEILSVGRVIEAGLDGTEQVALQGAFTLKAELTKGAAGHQHVH